jgi:hypothetical protein
VELSEVSDQLSADPSLSFDFSDRCPLMADSANQKQPFLDEHEIA